MQVTCIEMKFFVNVEHPDNVDKEAVNELIRSECDYRIEYCENGIRVKDTELTESEIFTSFPV